MKLGRIYRKARAQFAEKPSFFSWVREGKLAASGLLSSEAQVRWVAKQGVNTIVTLTEEHLPVGWLEKNRVSAKHVAMQDHAPPEVSKLKEASAFVADELKKGRVVLVHCQAGKGRTGSVIASYLILSEGMSAREAIDFLRKERPGSVESKQERSILDFEKTLRSGSGER